MPDNLIQKEVPREAALPEAKTGEEELARIAMANRVFFRLYQCANMLHKTGTRAVEDEGLTTQQWAILGALSRPAVQRGMGVGELARYLLVSRQNLSGVVSRMVRDGHLEVLTDERDRRARLVSITPHGQDVWVRRALPRIHDYYAQAMAGFSVTDSAHLLHYLLRMLENMKRIDQEAGAETLEGNGQDGEATGDGDGGNASER